MFRKGQEVVPKSLSVLLSLFLLLSCSYYEEGPIVSLRNPGKEIDGDWRVHSYSVDGVDSMWVIKDLHLDGKWSFNFIPTYSPSYYELPDFTITSYKDGSKYYYYGRWKSEKKEPKLTISVDYLTVDTTAPAMEKKQMPFLTVNGIAIRWKITKLTNKQMWLQAEKDWLEQSLGKHYELRFGK